MSARNVVSDVPRWAVSLSGYGPSLVCTASAAWQGHRSDESRREDTICHGHGKGCGIGRFPVDGGLQHMQAELGPDAFAEWAHVTAGLDRATLDDFLNFDGDLAHVNDRMLAAFVRVVSALN